MQELENYMARPIKEPDEIVVFICSECGCDIYEGETVCVLGGKPYCESCVRAAMQTAGV